MTLQRQQRVWELQLGEPLVQKTRYRPGAVGGVRDHGAGDSDARIVHTAERDARVPPFQHHGGRDACSQKPSPYRHRLRRALAARPHHLGDPVVRHDPAREERAPERADVRGVVYTPPSPAPRTGRWKTLLRERRRPRGSRSRAARELVRAKERRVAPCPAGSHTRRCTSSWNGTPLARSAISASTT